MEKPPIITEKDPEKAKKMIAKSNKPIILLARDDNYNRKMLEYGKFDMLLSPELEPGEDKLKQMNSGLNHVLAKIAAKKKIAIGIDLEKIKNLEKKEKAIILARIKQNINICRKAKARLGLLNKSKETPSLLISLGASTSQIKEAITF